MLSFKSLSFCATLGALITSAYAETHTITFVNDCGRGTPTLVQGSNILSTGGNFVTNGPLINAVAYLQTGNCGLNGEGCETVEITLQNGGSTVDISSRSVTTFIGFRYFNGCDGVGSSSPGQAVTCPADNVGLHVTFCD
ncbi:hypothetical protein K435DRAFT_968798 [Dendrothele bispora CBS 962.96]|uniref:Glycopeptide n=1 Tax=Dendrothele bispora (strain CBS 962.96) TaxID=1314807 RepID=A0A4S8LMA2_DENBC|nr:hypothetical protein K435DRAFT_968798 [Dendrothele bispora CBS 962.96]